jgi:dynein heavy chain
MRESLIDVCRRAYESYVTTDRIQWILEWPGQIVLCGSQMHWTMEVAEAIRKGKLAEYEAKCTLQLQVVVNKVQVNIYIHVCVRVRERERNEKKRRQLLLH